jgi:hypothetical protein
MLAPSYFTACSVAIVVLRSSVVVDGGTCYGMFLGDI